MINLGFTDINLKIIEIENKKHVFDIIRKKYIFLKPEELVRQTIIHFLINNKISKNKIIIEKTIKYNSRKKQIDILLNDKNDNPKIIFELKSFYTRLDQKAIAQVSTYNKIIKCPIIVISNGLFHYAWKNNLKEGNWIDKEQILNLL